MDELDQLVGLAKEGQHSAFSEIVLLLQQQVFRYCYPMIGHRQDAEDVVQETFVRAYTKLHQYEETGSFIGWILTIAHHLCLNKLKKRSRLAALFHRAAHHSSLQVDSHSLSSNLEVLAMLDSLPAHVRSLVILKVLHGMSYEEIGQIIHGKPNALRKQFERAKLKLRSEAMRAEHSQEGGAQVDY
ncbi:RNA polymerase sigma factor [Paenibacillus koleovorans]|uniref:RNA polymerase sigma factor n=1 Tax=Paenibacillus koleovorans TaxID=121608 RepID=UPI0013E2E85E|nr:RNA polymerase sigma factor [Paenibacillus koleovorans]